MSRVARHFLIQLAAAFLAVTVSLAVHPTTVAEPIFFGPIPYLSSADSPFDLSGLGTTMFLEDFEDGELNTPGVLGTDLQIFGPGPVPNTDSVDADDGVLDGFGLDGRSATGGRVCTDAVPPSCSSDAAVFFDATELGGLPTAAGIVWTDGSMQDGVSIIILDSAGGEIASSGRFHLGDDNGLGGTAEDRFFGVIEPAGISGIALVAGRSANEPGLLFEVDHLQYGFFVPEPGTCGVLLTGICALLTCKIRKRHTATRMIR